LQVAIKSSSLYSVSHPSAAKAINTTFETFQKYFQEKDVIAIQIQNSVVFWDKTPLDRDSIHVKNFTNELASRNVTGMIFQRKLTIEEFRTFMKIMGMKASKLDEIGGLQKALSTENILNVKVTIFTPSAAGAMPLDMDLPFGALPMLPEMQAFANFFAGVGDGLGSFTDRFFREAADNPKFMAQVVSRAKPDEAATEHPVLHYLRSLDKIASSYSAQVDGNPDAIRKVVVPVALSFEDKVKDDILVDGLEYAPTAGQYVTDLYQDIVSEIIADRVCSSYPERKQPPLELGAKALDLLKHSRNRTSTVNLIERKLQEYGMSGEELTDMLDHIYWNEYSLDEKLRRLMRGEKAYSKEFDKVYYTVLELIKNGKLSEAVTLFKGYIAGLRVPDEAVRREVATRCVKLIEPFPVSPERTAIEQQLTGELMGCLREESAAPVLESLIAGTTALIRVDLGARRFDQVQSCVGQLEQLFSSADVPTWKIDLIKNGLRQVSDQPGLIALLDSLHPTENAPRDEEVAACVRALGPNIIRPLVDLLAVEEDRVRRARIVESVQLIGPAAENTILAALDDERWFVVRNLVILLGDIGSERSVLSLEKMLAHQDTRVSRAAIRSLTKIGTAAAWRVLGRAIEKGSDELRLSVIQACAVPGNDAVMPPLLDIIRSKPQIAGADTLRKKAIEAAGKIGSRHAVRPLIDILEKRSLFSMAEDIESRIAAVRALGAIGGSEAVQALERAAKKDPKEDVRSEADQALAQIQQR